MPVIISPETGRAVRASAMLALDCRAYPHVFLFRKRQWLTFSDWSRREQPEMSEN
jgi:hypothetical protein